MPILFDTEVKPGDVISSDLFRGLLLKLEELDSRVSSLESGDSNTSGAVRLLGFIPVVQQRVGQLLEIEGVNFVTPLSANNLTIDGQPVNVFEPGSTTVLLRVIIPSAVSVPEGGDNVPIRVSNANGSHQLLYHVLPEIDVPGDPPSFDSEDVVNDNGSAQPLVVNEFCRINGENFASDPSDNVITFTVTTPAGTVVYPQAGETLEIDTSESDESLIRVQVPDITEVAVGATLDVTLQVVVGAHPPESANVTVIRAS